MTNTLNFPGSDRHAPAARHAPALPDRIEAICFAALGAAIVYSTTSGSYITLTTPRSLPYLIVGAILLFALSVAAWLGVFHADERSSFRFLVALVIPALLIAVPFQPGNGTGFVYKPSTLGAHEFELSRQFMSCCILDMTPFGFTTHYAKTAHLQEHDWVSVDATLVQGTYGIAGHTRQGPMLKITSLHTAKAAPTGYFYWQ